MTLAMLDQAPADASSADAPIDTAALAAWLAGQGIADGAVSDLTVLAGGTQNLTARFRCGGRDLVLRRPPHRADIPSTLRREAVVLATLADTDVPHARLRGWCTDPGVLGAPFLVTDAVDGFNATIEMPGVAGSDPAFRRRMGMALVEALAALARVSVTAGDLAALGRGDGFMERQAGRWAKQLAGYAELPGWAGPAALGPVAAIGEWLAANLPDDHRPGLMHGDYHIANVLFARDDGRVAAILDWELTALGDPLLDLARLVSTWPNARNEGLLSLKVEPWDGFPGRDALIDRYAALTGRSMAALPWFEVLACYKYGIILEGSNARAAAGRGDPATGARLHAAARGLIARAAQIIERF